MREEFLAVLSWAEAQVAARVGPGCQGLGQPVKPGQTQTLLLQRGTEIQPGPPNPHCCRQLQATPSRPSPLALPPCLPWLFPTPGSCIPQGWLCPVHHQLPASSPSGGPTPAAGASSCGWRRCPKAKPWQLGTMAVPETAPQTPQVGCHGARTHSSARGHSQAPWGFAPQLRQCLPLRFPNTRCSGAWPSAWSCAHSYSWAKGHPSHLFLWFLPPGISGLNLLPPPLPPLVPVLHLSSVSLPWFCDLVTTPCSCQGPSPRSKTEQIKFKSVTHSLLRWNKYFLLAKIIVTLSFWKKVEFSEVLKVWSWSFLWSK